MIRTSSSTSPDAVLQDAEAPEAGTRPQSPAGPTPSPAEASWLSANRAMAEAVLDDAKRDRRPAHRALFKPTLC